MAVQANGPAPYAPPATVISLIQRYRNHGLATPFTVDVLMRAGVTESLAPRTLQALRILDLIDSAGEPTEQFLDLAQARSDEFRDRLAAVIRSAYSEVFAFADPSTDDVSRIEDAFRSYTPRGQRSRMVTLFLGLCEEAGIATPAPRRQAAGPKKAAAMVTGRSARRGRPPAKSGAPRPPQGAPANEVPPALVGLLSELPVPGMPWTRDRRDTFIRTFGSVLDFLYPVRDDVDEPQEKEV
jgi:hypothetical protein